MNGFARKRGKSSCQLVFDLPRGPDGRRRQARHTIRGTKREAEVKLRELLYAVDRGEYVRPTKETVGAFLGRWLGTYAAANVSARTERDYRGIVTRYLLPQIGTIPLPALRPDQVQGLYAALMTRGLSGRTVLHTHRVLSEALSHAVKWQLIARNVCTAVDPPRAERKEMTTLDAAGVSHFFATAESSRYHDVLFVALYTGLRRSEFLGLKWSEIDLERGRISVVAGLHRLAGRGMVLLPTKTARSRRQISITGEVIDVLRLVRRRQIEQRLASGSAWHQSGFVFTDTSGNPIDPDRVTKEFVRLARLAGLEPVRLHDLRHTHASLMLQAGVHPKVVSERLGHASVAITMDVYSHVLPGIQEEAAERFARLLGHVSAG